MKRRLDKVSGDKFLFKDVQNELVPNDLKLTNEEDDILNTSNINIKFNLVDNEIIGSHQFIEKNELMNMEEDKVDMLSTKLPHTANDKQSNEHKVSQSAVIGSVSRHKKPSMHRTTNSIIGYNKETGNVIEAKALSSDIEDVDIKIRKNADGALS